MRLASRLGALLVFIWLDVLGRPSHAGLWATYGLTLPVALALYLVAALAELRVRVLLERDAVVIVHAFHRTRVPWSDVHEVRLRSRGSGRAWVELVRTSSRKVALPASTDLYPVLKARLAQTTANASAVSGKFPDPGLRLPR